MDIKLHISDNELEEVLREKAHKIVESALIELVVPTIEKIIQGRVYNYSIPNIERLVDEALSKRIRDQVFKSLKLKDIEIAIRDKE